MYFGGVGFLGGFFQKLPCPLTWVHILSSGHKFSNPSLSSSQQTAHRIKGWLAQGVFLTFPCFGKWCLSGGVKASPWAWRDTGTTPQPKIFLCRWHKKCQICLFILYFQCFNKHSQIKTWAAQRSKTSSDPADLNHAILHVLKCYFLIKH